MSNQRSLENYIKHALQQYNDDNYSLAKNILKSGMDALEGDVPNVSCDHRKDPRSCDIAPKPQDVAEFYALHVLAYSKFANADDKLVSEKFMNMLRELNSRFDLEFQKLVKETEQAQAINFYGDTKKPQTAA